MTGHEPRGDFALVYAVEPKDLDSIVEPEVVFGTTKLLPPLEVIPSECVLWLAHAQFDDGVPSRI